MLKYIWSDSLSVVSMHGLVHSCLQMKVLYWIMHWPTLEWGRTVHFRASDRCRSVHLSLLQKRDVYVDADWCLAQRMWHWQPSFYHISLYWTWMWHGVWRLLVSILQMAIIVFLLKVTISTLFNCYKENCVLSCVWVSLSMGFWTACWIYWLLTSHNYK